MKLSDEQIEEMVDFYHNGDNHYARHDFREGLRTARSFYEEQLKVSRRNIDIKPCGHVRGSVTVRDGVAYNKCRKCGELY